MRRRSCGISHPNRYRGNEQESETSISTMIDIDIPGTSEKEDNEKYQRLKEE